MVVWVALLTGVVASTGSAQAGVFVSRQGAALVLGDQPFRYVGMNYYYANARDNMPNGGHGAGYDGDVMDRDLSALDASLDGRAKVLRIWFFQQQATVDHRRDWAAFDHTLRVAARHGYKVIAVLTDQYAYTEGPYKDLSFYQGGYRTAVWATSTTPYLDYVEEVVSRYRDDPTVMAWQLVNEGKADEDASGACPSEQTAFGALYGFTSAMTSTIRRLDPNHLVSHGLLYNNCGTRAETTHYAQLSNLPYNDLYELHDYAGPAATMSTDATEIFAQAQAAARPAIVGETGIPRSVGLAERAAHFDAKFAAWFAQPAVAGVTPWVFNGQQLPSPVDHIFDITPGDPALTVLAKYGTPWPAASG
jgi:endo-1,4-beta-mannosidase